MNARVLCLFFWHVSGNAMEDLTLSLHRGSALVEALSLSGFAEEGVDKDPCARQTSSCKRQP